MSAGPVVKGPFPPSLWIKIRIDQAVQVDQLKSDIRKCRNVIGVKK